MREILFRGKRVDKGEWIVGFFAQSGERAYILIDNDFAVGYVKMKEVAPETVEQYTGLTDKNGKRIFEGDIVELYDRNYDTKWRAIVEFGNPNGNYSWGWQLNPIGKVDINTEILCWVEMEESGAYCEVIGNIHDNPELLEGTTNESERL